MMFFSSMGGTSSWKRTNLLSNTVEADDSSIKVDNQSSTDAPQCPRPVADRPVTIRPANVFFARWRRAYQTFKRASIARRKLLVEKWNNRMANRLYWWDQCWRSWGTRSRTGNGFRTNEVCHFRCFRWSGKTIGRIRDVRTSFRSSPLLKYIF